MPISDPHHPTLYSSSDSNAAAPECLGQKKVGRRREPDRLALTLDFARVSHEASSTHPHILFSPVHYESGYAYPLLVWLHDRGGDERQVMRIMPEISMRNYVAVAPQGIRQESQAAAPSKNAVGDWNHLDVAAILQAVRRSKAVYDWPENFEGVTEAEQRIFDCVSVAVQRNNIAPNRVFLAGFGSGGTMALRMAFLYPEHFAGVASLGGRFPSQGPVLHRWEAARSLSVFLGVGQTSEAFSPQEGCRALELLHTAGFPVAVREYDCGQELVPAMLQDLNRWMMQIVCGD